MNLEIISILWTKQYTKMKNVAAIRETSLKKVIRNVKIKEKYE